MEDEKEVVSFVFIAYTRLTRSLEEIGRAKTAEDYTKAIYAQAGLEEQANNISNMLDGRVIDTVVLDKKEDQTIQDVVHLIIVDYPEAEIFSVKEVEIAEQKDVDLKCAIDENHISNLSGMF